ncbi:ATP-dependent DNA helicase RecQ [Thaumasiovibrio sp. DFM-14]|uniref:RecQ family ATP-dependent DNA helicase n=1 Tax=Thaumasiovibrio sp. DFM-14 TaxID=3384792 RepID=UPI0039A33FBE
MIEQTLNSVFGFSQLRGGQQAVIDRVIQHQSCAAIFPTGSGKSLCYQLPALHLPHLTLVISPLLALIKDQLEFLHRKGIAAASIDSTKRPEEIQQILAAVASGEIKILMISVERLKNERFRHAISAIPISLLVVDEAHCISEWGHNFRPDYLKLPQYRDSLNIPQVLLLTATATPAVIDDMKNKFAINDDNVVVTGFYRPNLELTVVPSAQDKRAQLTNLILAAPQSPTIVYTTLQQTAEHVAAHLQRSSIHAASYHAGMPSEQREAIQNQFMAGDIDCVVATIAFGMGVDKANIRRVIHFDLPKSMENYSQEIGRAGRDGQPSQCTVLADRQGITTLENFIFGDTPDLMAIESLLAQVPDKTWHIKLNQLSTDTNIRGLALKTLLVYLEIEGIVEPGYSYYAEYRFKTHVPSNEIIQLFAGERRQFVEHLFNASPKARLWHQVDFELLWQRCNGERKRAIQALEYFEQQGLITLEAKQLTDVYHVRQAEFDRSIIAQRLFDLAQTKETAAIERIDNMLAFFASSQCLSYQLADYFADKQLQKNPQGCGHCSVCLGQPAQLPLPPALALPNNQQLNDWCAPYIAAVQGVVSNSMLAHYLCGLSSPIITKTKARKMAGYGALSNVPYRDVLASVEQWRRDA